MSQTWPQALLDGDDSLEAELGISLNDSLQWEKGENGVCVLLAPKGPTYRVPRGVSESSEASFARRSRMARFILNEAPSTHFLWVTHLKHLSREFRRRRALSLLFISARLLPFESALVRAHAPPFASGPAAPERPARHARQARPGLRLRPG